MSALYELGIDFSVADRRYLKRPLDTGGDPFDVRRLFSGERLEVAGEVFFPLSRAGIPLDLTLTAWDFLVTERIGSLIALSRARPVASCGPFRSPRPRPTSSSSGGRGAA